MDGPVRFPHECRKPNLQVATDPHALKQRAVGLNGNTRHELTMEKCVKEKLDAVWMQRGGTTELKKSLFRGGVFKFLRQTSV